MRSAIRRACEKGICCYLGRRRHISCFTWGPGASYGTGGGSQYDKESAERETERAAEGVRQQANRLSLSMESRSRRGGLYEIKQ